MEDVITSTSHLPKRGNNDIGGGFNDDPMWLILGTVSYIKETGDFGILDEMVPFDNDMSQLPEPYSITLQFHSTML